MTNVDDFLNKIDDFPTNIEYVLVSCCFLIESDESINRIIEVLSKILVTQQADFLTEIDDFLQN